jgi:hypothetical protein
MSNTDVWSRRPGILWAILAFVCLGTCCASSPDKVMTLRDRDAITLRMVQLAQAGRIDEAREHLRAYLADQPTDGTMYYNLACFDLLLDERDQAMVDLENALANGYSNFRLIEVDRSMAPLRHDPRFQALVETYEAALRDTFEARAITIEAGYPLRGIPLRSADPAPSIRADLDLSYDRDALSVTLTVHDPDHDNTRLPWDGGSGVLVNLIRPISHDDYESRRYHALGFGCDDGEPRGYFVSHDGVVVMRPLAETRPVISRQGDTTTYRIAIDWDVFSPYAPPLDQDMGLNVFYLGSGTAGHRSVLSLMAEDRLSFEPEPWRRYVPISFWTSDRSRPVVRGRIYDRMVESGEVSVEFAMWSLSEGPGEYRLDLVDARGERVTDPAPLVRGFDGFEGLNLFDDSYDLGALPDGTYRLELALDGPDGLPLTYGETFTRFDEKTLDRLNERIYRMAGEEVQILRYQLFVLARDLNRRHPQEDASHLLRDHDRISALVDICEAGGSCLPASGVVAGGFAVDKMTQRLCALYVPPGHHELASPHLLVVLPPRPGLETSLAAELGAALSDRPDVVVAVPQSHGITGLALTKASEHTELAVKWARDLFGAEDVTLVGLASGADAALAVSLARPELFDRVLLEADHLLLEEHHFSAESLSELLSGRRNELAYTLVSRLISAERLGVITGAMESRGFGVDVVHIDQDTDDAQWISGRLGR